MAQPLCPKCGKSLRTESGLGRHAERCHPKRRQEIPAQNQPSEAGMVSRVTPKCKPRRVKQPLPAPEEEHEGLRILARIIDWAIMKDAQVRESPHGHQPEP
jgi:hypothetical protein